MTKASFLKNSSDDVILEEDKESDYTLTTNPNNYQTNSNNCEYNNTSFIEEDSKSFEYTPAANPKSNMRADKLIMLSEALVERCFSKLTKHFLSKKDSLGLCTGKKQKSSNVIDDNHHT